MRMSRRNVVALTTILAVGAVACSDDDVSGTTATLPPATTTDPTATGATTTAPITTPTGSSTPTTAGATTQPAPTTTGVPTTTISVEEQTKAEIEADYLKIAERNWDLVSNPRLQNLERRVGQIATRRSALFRERVETVREMVELNDRYIEGEPPIRSTTVESIRLVGAPPYERALVTVCVVGNDNRVNVEPDGAIVYVGERLGLRAVRFTDPVQLTNAGWRIDRGERLIDPILWNGEDECGAP
jgi:hypothetical protein